MKSRNNRRRTRSVKGKRLGRLRSEFAERSFAHVCETGGARRTWLRTIEKVQKRYLLAAAAHNLGRIMRELFGMGTPRGLVAFVDLALASYLDIVALIRPLARSRHDGNRETREVATFLAAA